MVEHRTLNPLVEGSSPSALTPIDDLFLRGQSRPEPASPGTRPGSPAPPPSPGPAGEGRVATTIRLRLPAAALNSAWLYERMYVNPKLSYPEFASEIVRLGLAAFEHQAKRP